jgi:hypothetical protein
MTDAARAFRGFRFPAEVILWAVRWYLQFPISYRDLEAMLADRGVVVDHTDHVPLGPALRPATLCIAAYAFLIAERARLSPSAPAAVADQFATLGVSPSCKPRGAAGPSRTTCRKFNRDNAPTPDRRPRNHTGAMSVL